MSCHTSPCSGYFLPFEKTFKGVERFIFTSYARNVRNEYQIQRTGKENFPKRCQICFSSLGGAGESKET